MRGRVGDGLGAGVGAGVGADASWNRAEYTSCTPTSFGVASQNMSSSASSQGQPPTWMCMQVGTNVLGRAVAPPVSARALIRRLTDGSSNRRTTPGAESTVSMTGWRCSLALSLELKPRSRRAAKSFSALCGTCHTTPNVDPGFEPAGSATLPANRCMCQPFEFVVASHGP